MEPVDIPFDQLIEDIFKPGVKVPTTPGYYRAFVRTWDSLNLTSAWATVEFQVSAGGYATWAAGFGLTGGNALADADPDNDGLRNALEYAWNLNPSLADRHALLAGVGTNGLPTVSVWVRWATAVSAWNMFAAKMPPI